MIKALLKLEGLTVFLLSVYFYSQVNSNWWFFGLLFLVPDISMIGYMRNAKLGSITYNSVHNYVLAGVLIALGIIKFDVLLSVGLILAAHIALDRCLGLGLKYSSGFKDTHLDKV